MYTFACLLLVCTTDCIIYTQIYYTFSMVCCCFREFFLMWNNWQTWYNEWWHDRICTHAWEDALVSISVTRMHIFSVTFFLRHKSYITCVLDRHFHFCTKFAYRNSRSRFTVWNTFWFTLDSVSIYMRFYCLSMNSNVYFRAKLSCAYLLVTTIGYARTHTIMVFNEMGEKVWKARKTCIYIENNKHNVYTLSFRSL